MLVYSGFVLGDRTTPAPHNRTMKRKGKAINFLIKTSKQYVFLSATFQCFCADNPDISSLNILHHYRDSQRRLPLLIFFLGLSCCAIEKYL
ncbi:hypothetical protein [Planktothrix agardhii]|uniref:hypothetical protein n=1 Tax=Planktothrix agardhii TaxID=1160 RepID=UPI00041F8BA0|nr:hypothetical protein [Planktothrix agardhii]